MKITLIAGIAIIVVALLWKFLTKPAVAKTEGPISSWIVPDQLSIAQGDYEGKPMITRFNSGLRSLVGNPQFKKQLGIAVRFNHPTENGLPTSEEMKQLSDLEDEIRARFGQGNESLFAGIITTGNMREFIIYTSNADEASRKAEQIVQETKSYQIQFVIHDDPEWKNYKIFAGR